MATSSATSTHLAVDLGASGGRVLAGRFDGEQLRVDVVHRFDNVPVHIQDRLVWDVPQLWHQIQQGLCQAAAEGDVASVGVDTWGVDYGLLTSDDQIVGPCYHYRDPRTRGMLDQALERVPRRDIFAATGLQFMEINTLYQLFADVRRGSRLLDVADRFLMMPDLFHWLLSGEKSNEYTNASTTQMLNPNTGDWATEMLQRLGIPTRLFGSVTAPGTNLGPVQPSVASRTGLGGVPVILPASHDTGSAVLAVPAEGFAPTQPDWCYISSGTWSLMGCEIDRPLINETCSRLNFTNEGGVQGSTRLLKNIGGLWLFQQCRESFRRRGHDMSWPAMVDAARTATPHQLILDPDDPSFVAPDDMIDAIHQYAQRTGQPVPNSEGVLLRATLEGLALKYRLCLEWLEELIAGSIRTIHVVGGGVQNELLCQMTADACGRTVIAGPVEATAMGNVLMQMIGLGVLESVQEARAILRSSVNPTVYEPRNTEPWDAAAGRFKDL